MKLDPHKLSQYGPFSIASDDGWSLGEVFVDFETKLLIVHEKVFRQGVGAEPNQWVRRVTTVDIDSDPPRIVPVDERSGRIDYSERVEIDESLKLKSVVRRSLDRDSGDETITDELFSADSAGALRARTTRPAFHPSQVPTYLDNHRRKQGAKTPTDAEKAFAARVAYWSGQIHRHMRNQSESGLDEYGGFTPEWYEHGKSVDRNFDKILRTIVQRDKGEFAYQGFNPAELLRRIGKPELANPGDDAQDEPGLLDKLRGLLGD